MTGAFVLWGHALAALAFAVLGIDQARRARAGWPAAWFVAALFATGAWALAVAGIDARDLATRLAEGIRDLAWLGFMHAAVRRDRAGGPAVAAVYVMAAVMALSAVMLAIAGTAHLSSAAIVAVAEARTLTGMIGAIAALVLLHHLHGSVGARGLVKPVVAALAVMWGADLAIGATAYAAGMFPTALVAVRGFAMVAAALLVAIATRRGGDWTFALSRTATIRSLLALALLGYAGLTIALTMLAGRLGAPAARIAQTAIIVAASVALATLLSTPWLRAWTKVKVAKHLFSHRYDYRAEWQRFTTTLGAPGPGADPLDRRIVKAIADLTDSPAGLLLVPDGAGLGDGTGWRWEGSGGASAALVDHLAATARIVELDTIRARTAPPEEADAIPRWMIERDDAWALVPLIHGNALVGAILLARPPIDRALDWEDLDLLRVAGRQAASYLAEERAHDALNEAARFDEFNRRFAYIMHDIKNLVSGLTLVARNAERHADNPEFRADMVATLQESAARMNALLARLSQHHRSAAETAQPVDIAALAARIAHARRAQHRILVEGDGIALAQPARLEQILGHLVQNAIEASPADGPVVIAAAVREDAVTIDVVDRGCGMAPAFVRDQLFRPFASSKPDGFGIGAYEARQLAGAMGGSIEVASEPGAGSRFRIVLPRALPMEAAA